MKEEIETKHFEHTRGSRDEPRCRATPTTKQVEVCAFHHNLSHGFYRVMSVKFLFPGFERTNKRPDLFFHIQFNDSFYE